MTVKIIKIGSVVKSFTKGQSDLIELYRGSINDYYIDIIKRYSISENESLFEFIYSNKDSVNIKYSELDIKLHKFPKVGENTTGIILKSNQYCGSIQWSSTTVNYIIDDKIFITKNSVYAIYDLSEVRDSKINKLLK